MASPTPSSAAAAASVPTPAVPLNGHCSVIYNSNGVDTLYTYQKDAFQSLPLSVGAKWASLPGGVSVNGAKCVLGQWNHQDALIVVGGTVTDQAQKDYPGLQYFTFATNAWASIPAGNSVLQNRQMHNAAYLQSSNSLLVFSGFQDNSFRPSSETFTISAEPPYTVDAHSGTPPPGGMNPELLPWNASHAVMIGGSQDQRQVWLFGKEQQWHEIGVGIPGSITNVSNIHAAIIDGTGDAKAIQLFDFQASPNTVTSLTVQASESLPASGAVRVREIDLGHLPSYNGSTASIVERNGYSLAQSPVSGLVVASGGTGDAASPVALFNQSANGWIPAKEFFSGKRANSNIQNHQSILASSTSTAASSTATDSTSTSTSSAGTITSSAATPSSTPSDSGGLSDSGRTILGGVLGGLAGAAALLILLLLCLRWKKQKRRNRGGNYQNEDKHQMEFDDSDAIAGFKRSASKASRHSMKDEWQRMPTAQEKLGAPISRPNLIYDSTSPTGLLSPHGLSQPLISSTLPPTKSRSDDGWNQYFAKSGSSGHLMSESSPDRVRVDTASRKTKYTESNYNVESHSAQIYHDNDTLPLNPGSEQKHEQSGLQSKHGRAPSSNYNRGSLISEEDEPESFLNAPSSSSGTQAHDFLGVTGSQFDQRPTSSLYTDSFIFPHPGDKVHISGDKESSLNSTGAVRSNSTNNAWRAETESRGMRTLATKDLTGGKKDDMSWLNLGK